MSTTTYSSNNVLNAVAIGAAAFAITLLVICFVL